MGLVGATIVTMVKECSGFSCAQRKKERNWTQSMVKPRREDAKWCQMNGLSGPIQMAAVRMHRTSSYVRCTWPTYVYKHTDRRTALVGRWYASSCSADTHTYEDMVMAWRVRASPRWVSCGRTTSEILLSGMTIEAQR